MSTYVRELETFKKQSGFLAHYVFWVYIEYHAHASIASTDCCH